MSLQDVQEVYDECRGAWTGLDWPCPHGSCDVDIWGMSADELRKAAAGKKQKHPFCQQWREERGAQWARFQRDDRDWDDDEIPDEDADEVLEREMIEAAEYIESVEEEAERAEELASQAMASAEAGDWHEALELAREAARVERQYGDCPVWGQLVQAIEEAMLERETAEAENDVEN